MAEYSLIPFPDLNIPDIQITGRISRRDNLLTVQHELTGEIKNIFFPTVSSCPTRKDNLWKTTCFEFFLAIPDHPHYWEFNMSPSGDWNTYRMDAYRQIGLCEEASIQRLPFSIQMRAECFIVETILDLTLIVEEDQQIQAAITSVIQETNAHETYWALMHPGPQADFHRREGFIIQL